MPFDKRQISSSSNHYLTIFQGRFLRFLAGLFPTKTRLRGKKKKHRGSQPSKKCSTKHRCCDWSCDRNAHLWTKSNHFLLVAPDFFPPPKARKASRKHGWMCFFLVCSVFFLGIFGSLIFWLVSGHHMWHVVISWAFFFDSCRKIIMGWLMGPFLYLMMGTY